MCGVWIGSVYWRSGHWGESIMGGSWRERIDASGEALEMWGVAKI